jgi:hypothetical protein
MVTMPQPAKPVMSRVASLEPSRAAIAAICAVRKQRLVDWESVRGPATPTPRHRRVQPDGVPSRPSSFRMQAFLAVPSARSPAPSSMECPCRAARTRRRCLSLSSGCRMVRVAMTAMLALAALPGKRFRQPVCAPRPVGVARLPLRYAGFIHEEPGHSSFRAWLKFRGHR